MKKGRHPRKSNAPKDDEQTGGEQELEVQTQEKAELVPPAPRPPFVRLVQALRTVAGAILDIADAAAAAITKR